MCLQLLVHTILQGVAACVRHQEVILYDFAGAYLCPVRHFQCDSQLRMCSAGAGMQLSCVTLLHEALMTPPLVMKHS